MSGKDIEQLAVDTIRVLSMDAVQKANSGHPGMPMGMADIAVTLWSRFLDVDPSDPTWPDRDRFVLSNGHGSMLLYSLLHLCGFPMPMDQLQHFRQFGYHTAGHPEIAQRLGIETTTGPLGQGFGMGVGMAIAEEHLRHTFGSDLVDHRVFAFVSDGDLEEGVSSEAASLAGHLRLGRLIYLYDDNEISIEGDTDITFTEDVEMRFQAYGWHTQVVDGHDRDAVGRAIGAALDETGRPSLITCRTHIGYGAPHKQDTAEAHGSPLGEDEIALVKEAIGWDAPPFHVPQEVYDFFSTAMSRGAEARREWEARRDAAFDEAPDLGERWARYHDHGRITLDVPFETGASVATRKASQKAIQEVATVVPGLVGGSADLAPSTNTLIDSATSFSVEDRGGRNLHFGVREHAMGTIVNGITVHGGLRAFGATFLTFSDYMRPAVRISALMEAPSIWVWTHDSIFLGEDGPTHQPIEHLASLRAMPGIWVVRPADAGETVEAWQMAINRREGPTALALTRQSLPVLDRTGRTGKVHLGGYVLRDGRNAVLVATGSEVWVALEAARSVEEEHGLSIRVVSMPCVEAFLAQDAVYRAEVLGTGLPVASLEAGATWGWERITGNGGLNIGVDHFGASAPAGVLAEEYGINPGAVAERLVAWIA
jgi:transketolase